MTSCASRFSASGTRISRCTAPRKVWRQLRREEIRVARCTVRRLMRAMGLVGAGRGRAWVSTTHAESGGRAAAGSRRSAVYGDASESALGVGLHVRGDVARALSMSPSSSTSLRGGSSAGASRRRCRTDFVLDALEQAIYDRGGDGGHGVVHHSDRGTQYLSMRVHRSAGRRRHRAVGGQPRRFLRQCPRRIGDRALQNGGDSTEGAVAARSRPWNSPRSTWVDWFNHRRLLEPIGYVPPAEYEAQYYEQAAVA